MAERVSGIKLPKHDVPTSSATDTSENTSEPEPDMSESDLDPAYVRHLKRELERMTYKNTHLNAQLKRQIKLNEQLVSFTHLLCRVPLR
eukprot:950900-Pleurochrysis_carterae.AAC.13